MASQKPVELIRRHRSVIACQGCRLRKVRCSLSVTGVPCTTCTQDGTDCLVSPRRPRQRRNQRDRTSALYSPPGVAPQTDFANVGPSSTIQPCSSMRVDVAAADDAEQTASCLDCESASIYNEERSGIEIAEAALGVPRRVGQLPFYSGEQLGLHVGSSVPRHFLIPSGTETFLEKEDREYLKAKGVLTLPQNDTCAALLRVYLSHVHPVYPVIEVEQLWDCYHNGRLGQYNLLLLWSIFSVAVNFISSQDFEREGYKSRRHMKAVMYSRAKCMYNNGGERDLVIRLQASFLMGFWSAEPFEHVRPWYWTGIAINYCQMLGLHRNPDSAEHKSSISEPQRRLWRRIWWSCVFRDRWLGLCLGRPQRINLDDCDVPMPTVDDVIQELEHLPHGAYTAFMPVEMPRLATYWIILLKLSRLLGTVLSINHQARDPRAPSLQIRAMEDEILQCTLPDQYEAGQTRLASFYVHHIHLHHQALLITFYRHNATECPDDIPSTQREDWKRMLCLKASTAALRTNDILDLVVRDGLLEFAGPMTPPLLIPAMQMHLLDCKSPGSLPRRLGLKKLEACLLVLEGLQKTYAGASIHRGIFLKAIQHMFPGYATGSALSSETMQPVVNDRSETIGDASASETFVDNVSAEGSAPTDDFLDTLLDDGAFFPLWLDESYRTVNV
ncbi:Transcription factor, fungi [Metarhizium guizhouense ARSEF 977]|uniref:Transcription factor, fungi n=1 Tax=Metarhizium guizhouense (strain ARSEF 977) TaxID=1276136 RepID=A0A0B4GG75_METGA|nr:Transcription factor, fungi [Metarhizium guizhouense ARSEF 977]